MTQTVKACSHPTVTIAGKLSLYRCVACEQEMTFEQFIAWLNRPDTVPVVTL